MYFNGNWVVGTPTKLQRMTLSHELTILRNRFWDSTLATLGVTLFAFGFELLLMVMSWFLTWLFMIPDNQRLGLSINVLCYTIGIGSVATILCALPLLIIALVASRASSSLHRSHDVIDIDQSERFAAMEELLRERKLLKKQTFRGLLQTKPQLKPAIDGLFTDPDLNELCDQRHDLSAEASPDATLLDKIDAAIKLRVDSLLKGAYDMLTAERQALATQKRQRKEAAKLAREEAARAEEARQRSLEAEAAARRQAAEALADKVALAAIERQQITGQHAA